MCYIGLYGVVHMETHDNSNNNDVVIKGNDIVINCDGRSNGNDAKIKKKTFAAVSMNGPLK